TAAAFRRSAGACGDGRALRRSTRAWRWPRPPTPASAARLQAARSRAPPAGGEVRRSAAPARLALAPARPLLLPARLALPPLRSATALVAGTGGGEPARLRAPPPGRGPIARGEAAPLPSRRAGGPAAGEARGRGWARRRLAAQDARPLARLSPHGHG